jgi:hypothetical protein
MELKRIKISDGKKANTGWLVLSDGMARGILVPDPIFRTKIRVAYAHDRSIQSCGTFYLMFPSLETAAEWLEHRLEPASDMGIPISGENYEYTKRLSILACQ